MRKVHLLCGGGGALIEFICFFVLLYLFELLEAFKSGDLSKKIRAESRGQTDGWFA